MPAMAVARAAPPLEVLEVLMVATRSPLAEEEALDSEAEEEEPLLVAVVMVESVLVIEADDALAEDMLIEAMEEDDMAREVEPEK